MYEWFGDDFFKIKRGANMQKKKLSKSFKIPKTMKAWVLGDPNELKLTRKPVPEPGTAEVLVKVDAVAICGTDLEIFANGLPAMIEGGMPFNKNFTPGHEYMGTVVKLGPGVDEFKPGDRVRALARNDQMVFERG